MKVVLRQAETLFAFKYLALTLVGATVVSLFSFRQHATVIINLSSLISIAVFMRWGTYGPRTQAVFNFVDRHARLLLASWVLGYLAWCGLVLFSNPYTYETSHGDAVFASQTLWNLTDGLRPENSFFTFSDIPSNGSDPRYFKSDGYVSVFSLHQCWLPMAVLSPLYAIFPKPPMHVFALQICILAFGVPGMYWAARQAGLSRPLSVVSAIGYSLLPQVDTQLFFKGYFDALALGVLPWLFGALIGRKWRLMYVFAFLTASISFPYTYFVTIVGLATMIFFRGWVPGAIVALIGWMVLRVDTAVYAAAVSPYIDTSKAMPSFLQLYVLDRTIGSLGYNFKINSAYIIVLMQGLAYMPLLALWRNHRWNMPILGFWAILAGAFVMMLFRSAGWEFQRNSLFIVPVFVMALIGYADLVKQAGAESTSASQVLWWRKVPTAMLLGSMAVLIFLGPLYNNPPLGSHLPWGESGYIRRNNDTMNWDGVLKKLYSVVPASASIAWRASPEVQAILTNRQHSWSIGREPEGVSYYVFLGNAQTTREAQEWDALIEKFRQQPNLKLAYEEVAGQRLIVFKNQDAHAIRRNENHLGWTVLLKALSGAQKLPMSGVR